MVVAAIGTAGGGAIRAGDRIASRQAKIRDVCPRGAVVNFVGIIRIAGIRYLIVVVRCTVAVEQDELCRRHGLTQVIQVGSLIDIDDEVALRGLGHFDGVGQIRVGKVVVPAVVIGPKRAIVSVLLP